jgi:hypothetical protein
MKNIFKTIILTLLVTNIYGQSISVEPANLKFNPVLGLSAFNNTEPGLVLSGTHPTFKPSLTIRHNNSYIGTITSNQLNDFRFFTNQGFRFQVNINSNFVDALSILPNGSVGIGTDPSINAKLDVEGNIRSASLDFTEQNASDKRLLFADNNGVIRADNSTNQYQSYNFTAIHPQDYTDQLIKGSGYAWINTTNIGATIYLPVNLPDGVKVSNIRAFLWDDSASDLVFTFSRNSHLSNSFSTISTATTTGASAAIRFFDATANETIQNQSNSYYVNISSVGNWIGNNLRFHSIVITYNYQ